MSRVEQVRRAHPISATKYPKPHESSEAFRKFRGVSTLAPRRPSRPLALDLPGPARRIRIEPITEMPGPQVPTPPMPEPTPDPVPDPVPDPAPSPEPTPDPEPPVPTPDPVPDPVRDPEPPTPGPDPDPVPDRDPEPPEPIREPDRTPPEPEPAPEPPIPDTDPEPAHARVCAVASAGRTRAWATARV